MVTIHIFKVLFFHVRNTQFKAVQIADTTDMTKYLVINPPLVNFAVQKRRREKRKKKKKVNCEESLFKWIFSYSVITVTVRASTVSHQLRET